MGQQQILILLLVVIIVGIAIIVGINVFKSEEIYFEESAFTQMMLETAEEAQAWYAKPKELGGGGKSFIGIDFTQIPCPSNLEIAGVSQTSGSRTTICQHRDSASNMDLYGISNIHKDSLVINAGLSIRGEIYTAKLSVHPDHVNWIDRWEE